MVLAIVIVILREMFMVLAKEIIEAIVKSTNPVAAAVW